VKILAVKLADLGDLLLTEPGLRSLRQGFPDARIDVLTTPRAEPLLRLLDPGPSPILFDKAAFDSLGQARAGSALAAGRLAARLRAAHYDRVVLFHHLTTARGAMKFRALAATAGAALVAGLDNGRGAFLTHPVLDRGFGERHEAEYMLDVAIAAGGQAVDPRPRIEAPPARTPVALPDRFIVLAPVSGPHSRAREWPLGRFVELAGNLTHNGHAVTVVGGADAAHAGEAIRTGAGRASVIDLTGKTSIPQLAGVLGQARLVIGSDSFPAHLAAALATPVLTIFGPSNHAAWAPYGSLAAGDFDVAQPGAGIVVRADLPCSPCLYTGYELGRREGCPRRTCLTAIDSNQVFRAAMELLGA
jgi:heptosyltransferase-2